jgi:hypothetical protein
MVELALETKTLSSAVGRASPLMSMNADFEDDNDAGAARTQVYSDSSHNCQ